MIHPRDPTPAIDESLATIGVLHDALRRSLYLYVVAQPGDVSREEAATAVGIQRNLAAFHLDKLVDAGLLEVEFRRTSGRTGRGAGRPAKLYRRSPGDRTVSLPPRRYDLAAALLAEAVEEAGDGPVRTPLAGVARRFGRRLGEDIRARLRPRASRVRRMSALAEGLDGYGYEPRWDGNRLRLANCPFHALSDAHRELVCGMNRSLLDGVLEGMDGDDLQACPNESSGECCIAVVPRRRQPRSSPS